MDFAISLGGYVINFGRLTSLFTGTCESATVTAVEVFISSCEMSELAGAS